MTPRKLSLLWILAAVLAACGGKAVTQQSSSSAAAGTGAKGGTGSSGATGGTAATGGTGGSADGGGLGGSGGSISTGGFGNFGGSGGSGGSGGTGGSGGASGSSGSAGTGGTGADAGTGGTSSGFKCHCKNWTDDAYPKLFYKYPEYSCVIQGCPDGEVCCASSCFNPVTCYFDPKTFNQASCDPDNEYNDCCVYLPTYCVFPEECAEDGVLTPRPQTSADTLHYCNGIE